MKHLFFILVILCAVTDAAGERKLYFTEPSNASQHIPVGNTLLTFMPGGRIDLYLQARTRSMKDRHHFVDLIIDDYRYDEPNYFADKRVPNVTFEVARLENGSYKRVPFRASSQSGGVSLEYLDVHVSFEIGGSPEKLEEETKKVYQEVAAKALRPEDAMPRIEGLRRQFEPNQPGRYRIRAFYRPNVPGRWKGKLATPAITISISDDR